MPRESLRERGMSNDKRKLVRTLDTDETLPDWENSITILARTAKNTEQINKFFRLGIFMTLSED
jgi:hypothetical protein